METNYTNYNKKTPAMEDGYSSNCPTTMEQTTTHEIIAHAQKKAIEIETPFGNARLYGELSDGTNPFPSLSKGTLNRTFTKNTPKYLQTQQTSKHSKSATPSATQKPQKLTNTYYLPYTLYTKSAKVYSDKVIINKFKRVIARSTGDIPPLTRTPHKKQTPEEAQQSRERSIARTKRELLDLVRSNDFDKFGTLTFDPKKHPQLRDREYVMPIFTRFMNDQKKIYGDFKYLAVPETMKDGKIHFHVLFGGYKGKLIPTNTRRSGGIKRQAYKLASWEKKYGFADFEDIGSTEHLGLYLAKYISKDFETSSLQAGNKKRYMASRNLLRPTQIIGDDEVDKLLSNGTYSEKPSNVYENEYLEQLTFDKL